MCSIWLSGKLISHIFREPEVFLDTEWERYFCYKDIAVPDVYTGPHLTFPLSVGNVTDLLEAFKQKQVGRPGPYLPTISEREILCGSVSHRVPPEERTGELGPIS